MVFDLEKYKNQQTSKADLKKAKQNLNVFFSAYKSSREKVGQPREPRITATWSEPPSQNKSNTSQVESLVIRNEEDREEFKELHALYIKGMASILHTSREDITERRRKVFYKRFIKGLAIYQIALEVGYSEDTIGDDINEATVQFAKAIGILENC